MQRKCIRKRNQNLFEQNNIIYDREYSIPELLKKRYDFYIYYNNQKCLFELDGIQHFTYDHYFHKTVDKP